VPFYAYKARNARGEMLQGTLESADSGAAADQLFSTGATPIEIVATQSPATKSGDGWWERFSEQKISPMDVQLFSRQLYTLMKSGVPIMRGLTGLQESAINKTFAKVVQDLRESLGAGRELSAAMHRHPQVFSAFYVSMVRIGEATGRLDAVLLRLFDHLEFEREMRDRVKSALRYPMFVSVAMIIAIGVINLFVIPAFAKVYEGFNAPLPLLTKVLINTSNFTMH
jgi:MSHA biogenesis protein MshG